MVTALIFALFLTQPPKVSAPTTAKPATVKTLPKKAPPKGPTIYTVMPGGVTFFQ